MNLRMCDNVEIGRMLDIIKRKYADTIMSWSLSKIEVDGIIPLCKHVYAKRLVYAFETMQSCNDQGLLLYYPYIVNNDEGQSQIIVPPIVEARNDKLYLCDGMHRLFVARQKGIKELYVLLAEGCVFPLPGVPQTWDTVTVEQQQLPVEQNIDGLNRQWFTGYSKFCNSDAFVCG